MYRRSDPSSIYRSHRSDPSSLVTKLAQNSASEPPPFETNVTKTEGGGGMSQTSECKAFWSEIKETKWQHFKCNFCNKAEITVKRKESRIS